MPNSNTIMIRLGGALTLVLWWGSCAAAARVPKIYNALITSDENLSPSQAFPIVEPVLRTTALGVAPYASPLFQPLAVQQPQTPAQPSGHAQDPTPSGDTASPSNVRKLALRPQLTYHDAYPLYPLAYDPHLPYGYQQEFVYSPPLPFYQQPVYVDYAGSYQQQQPQLAPDAQNVPSAQVDNQAIPRPVLPPHVPQTPQAVPPQVNFKKNPEIPDVIPPLPFTLRKEKKQRRNET